MCVFVCLTSRVLLNNLTKFSLPTSAFVHWVDIERRPVRCCVGVNWQLLVCYKWGTQPLQTGCVACHWIYFVLIGAKKNWKVIPACSEYRNKTGAASGPSCSFSLDAEQHSSAREVLSAQSPRLRHLPPWHSVPANCVQKAAMPDCTSPLLRSKPNVSAR